MDFINNLLDKDFPYIMIFGVCVLLAIFVIIGIALAKTAGYFVERFPREESEQIEYLNYKARAEMLKAQIDSYNEQIEKLRDEYNLAIKEAKDNLSDLSIKDDLQIELEKVERSLEQAQNELFITLKEKAKSHSEVEFLQDSLPKLKDKKDQLQKEIDALKANLEQIKAPNGEYKKVQEKFDKLNNNYQELNKNYEKLDKDYRALAEDFNLKKDSLVKVEKKIDQLNGEASKKSEIETKINSLNLEVVSKQTELSALNNNLAQGRIELSKLEAICGKLSADIERQHDEKRKFEEGYSRLVEIPNSLKIYAKGNKIDSINIYKNSNYDTGLNSEIFLSENEELAKFSNYLEEQGFIFSNRVINAFHTALKIQDYNPLTVLAGISGTGKTLLPTKYAEYFGIYALVIPVEPRWDSPQDLLGFYNYLEKKYQATELARTLVAFDPFNQYILGNRKRSEEENDIAASLKDRMLIVLLDEMNLARTEYYFANFLSRLELRRTVKDPREQEQRRKAEITIDDQFGNIWVPENVLFVGTMNEDESTQTLSDKVLDRANILRFGKPDDDNVKRVIDSPKGISTIKAHKAISYSTYKSWLKKDNNYEACEKVSDIIQKINEAMDKVGKSFGYRVSGAIHAYVRNYPDSDEMSINNALADQIEQKIMPKLRGLDLSDSNVVDCLNEISSVISEINDDALCEAFKNAKEDNLGTGMFIWQGISRKL